MFLALFICLCTTGLYTLFLCVISWFAERCWNHFSRKREFRPDDALVENLYKKNAVQYPLRMSDSRVEIDRNGFHPSVIRRCVLLNTRWNSSLSWFGHVYLRRRDVIVDNFQHFLLPTAHSFLDDRVNTR